MSNTYKIKSKAVASKFLYKIVTEFVGEMINEFSILYQHNIYRDSVLEVIEEFLAELGEEGKITQYNVICDNRNNNEALAKQGITHLEIRYKQDNCYTVTILNYEIDACED